MNIVHIIGNGFDLNLHLKTSYKDFYKYYVEIKSDNPVIEIFKTEIKSYLNNKSILVNWSDLEIALFKRSQKNSKPSKHQIQAVLS